MIRNLVQCGCAALLLILSLPAFAQVAPANGNPTRADLLAYLNQVDKVRPGLGYDAGEPVVTPFALPEGMRVVGEAVGADENGKCPDDSDFGTLERAVQVCLPVCYVGRNVANVIFPTGLIITAAHGFQNGVLIERTVIPVPPTACNPSAPPTSPDRKEAPVPKNAFWIKLSTFCLNENQDPSSPDGRYQLGGVTADPDLLALVQFLDKRDLRGAEADKVVQRAVFSITEGKGLTWQDRKDLHRLPLRR